MINLPALATGADILRIPTATDYLYNLIYLHTTGDIVTRHTEGVTNIELFALPNPFVNNGTEVQKPKVAADYTDDRPKGVVAADPATTRTFNALTAGYYGLRFKYAAAAYSASYQSNAYACPVLKSLDFNTRGAFDPCGGTLVFPFPNAPVNLHQQYVNQAHGCGNGQFFNGTCNNVDPTKNCNTFNPLSGDCQTCPNSNFVLTGGRCVQPPAACATGSTPVGVNCVSDLCATSTASGACASCKSIANEVKADGSCGAKTCTAPLVLNTATGVCEAAPSNCPAGQAEVQGNCYALPANCLALSPWLTCSRCADNTRIERGECIPCNGPCVTCPGRQFLNGAQGCSPVSPQCDGFDATTGQCTSCLSGAAPVNGVCCPAGQTPQGNVCVTIGGATAGGATTISFLESAFFRNCQTVDVVNQTCTQCRAGRNFVAGTRFCA